MTSMLIYGNKICVYVLITFGLPVQIKCVGRLNRLG